MNITASDNNDFVEDTSNHETYTQSGQRILATVSRELSEKFGKGYTYSGLNRMIKVAEFYSDEKKFATLSRTYYIHVEKYDWNGQPVAKYRLDQWGYFTVDEENNLLYLVSTNHDSSFFKYQLV